MWVEPHGAKWRIRDTVAGKKVTVESGFPTKTVAKQRKQRLEIEKIDLGPVKAGADRTNFGEWAAAWWKGHARTFGSEQTRKTETSRFKRHVVDRLGHLAFREVEHAVIRAWLDDLADPEDGDYDPLAPKSILNVHGYLYMCLATAVKERVIRSNPCGESELPKWEPSPPRFLTEQELAEVIGALPPKWRPLAAFIAGTGCRAGEALGLRQRRVDLLAGRVRFEAQMRVVAGAYVDVPLKTKASRRTVGVGPSLTRMLLAEISPDEDAFMFRNEAGKPIPYST
ncbi:tyrosine-type recombinase/integrase, partial [Glycomyces paridis]|uniref:tyrosine-type recombinase/integrase n=1 Tax=Glycomyces paridis TaxID=2126555 RepID=UPI0019597CCF